MRKLTILLSIFLAIALLSPLISVVRADWVSPTSSNDPDSAYSYDERVYDEAVGTDAYDAGCTELHYLEVFPDSPISCSKVRIYAAMYYSGSMRNPAVRVGVYYDGGWHTIHDGYITKEVWVEIEIGSTEVVSGARMGSDYPLSHNIYFGEFDFWEVPIVVPTVTTQDATGVTHDVATLHGSITDTGGENCDERGFDYDNDTSGVPYAYSWTESDSYGTGAFDHEITNLSPETTYYFRAKAHNSEGWGYGSEKSFITESTPPIAYIVDLAKTFTIIFSLQHQTNYSLPLTFSPTISFTLLVQSAFHVLLSFAPSISFIILLQSAFTVLLNYTTNIAFSLLASAGYIVTLIFQPSISFVLDLVYTAYAGVLYIVDLVFAPTIAFIINSYDLIGVTFPSWLIELNLYPNWDIIIVLIVSIFFCILFFARKEVVWGYIGFVGWLILGMIWLFINPISYFVSILFFAIAIIILALTLILQVEALRMVEGRRLGEESMTPV